MTFCIIYFSGLIVDVVPSRQLLEDNWYAQTQQHQLFQNQVEQAYCCLPGSLLSDNFQRQRDNEIMTFHYQCGFVVESPKAGYNHIVGLFGNVDGSFSSIGLLFR